MYFFIPFILHSVKKKRRTQSTDCLNLYFSVYGRCWLHSFILKRINVSNENRYYLIVNQIIVGSTHTHIKHSDSTRASTPFQISTTMYVSSLNVNNIHFHEISFGTKGQKMVDLAFDPNSKAWSQRIIVQLCKDETEALFARYGLSKPRDEQDSNKRNIELKLENNDVIQKLKAIDDRVVNYAVKESKSLFRKDLSEEQVRAKYKGLLKCKEDGSYHFVNIKVKCNADEKPTPIKVLKEGGNTLSTGDFTDLTAGCKVVPVARILTVWFMSDTFGLSLQADKLMVIPGVQKSFLDDFVLTRSFVVEKK